MLRCMIVFFCYHDSLFEEVLVNGYAILFWHQHSANQRYNLIVTYILVAWRRQIYQIILGLFSFATFAKDHATLSEVITSGTKFGVAWKVCNLKNLLARFANNIPERHKVSNRENKKRTETNKLNVIKVEYGDSWPVYLLISHNTSTRYKILNTPKNISEKEYEVW